MKTIIKSSQIIYDYLVEKKGYFLDKIHTAGFNDAYLEGLMKG